MTNASDGDMTEDSPFSGGFDLYSSGKRRRGGLRRLAPASTAVTEPAPAPDATSAPEAPAEPRSFSRMFARRESQPETVEETPRLRQDDVEHPDMAALSSGAAMAADGTPQEPTLAHESPMLSASPLYASRAARKPAGATRLALPAVAVIAVAAGAAWFLMNPAHTAHTDRTSMVAGGGSAPVATAAAAPAPVAVAPLAPPAAAIAPPETAAPPAPIATAAPPPQARIARTTTTVTTTSTAHRVAANARHAPRTPARSADTSAADISTRASDTAPTYTPPAYTPPAYTPAPAPAPVITAAPPAPTMTPQVTPPVDPSGAVNAPTTP